MNGDSLGPGIHFTLRPTANVVQGAALASANAISLAAVTVTVRRSVAAGVQVIGDASYLAITAAGKAATQVLVKAEQTTVKAVEIGGQVIEYVISIPVSAASNVAGAVAGGVEWTVQYSVGTDDCTSSPNAWDFRRGKLRPGDANDRGPADPDRIPVILVHGIQLLQPTCNLVERFQPDAAGQTWPDVVNLMLSDPNLKSRFDPWIFRYPTFYSIESNGERLAGFINKAFPGRDILILAHSMGGLVSAYYLAINPPNGVRQLITLDTPFAGTELAQGFASQSQLDAAWSCVGPLGPGAIDLVSLWSRYSPFNSVGFRELASGSGNTLLISLAYGRQAFEPRLTALGSGLTWNSAIFSTHAFKMSVLGCMMSSMGYSPNDGVVTQASSLWYGKEKNTLSGLDHEQVTSAGSVIQFIRTRMGQLSTQIPTSPSSLTAPVSNLGAVGANSTVSISVVVRDKAGVAVPGVSVAFVTSSGSVSPSVAASDQNGLALAFWKLGATTGAQSARASIPTAAVPPVDISATVAVPAALAILLQPTSGTTGQPLSPQPVVEVRDAFGNHVAGATNTVTASLASGSGTLSGTVAVTAVNGTAQFANLVLTGSGEHSLRFASPGLSAVSSSPIALSASCSVRSVNLPFNASGSILQTSCLYNGLGTDLYSFSTPSQGGVRLQLASSAFAPYLGLFSADVRTNWLFFARSAPGTAVAKWVVPAGNWTSTASSALPGQTGSYSLAGSREGELPVGCETVSFLPFTLVTNQAISAAGCYGSTIGYFDRFATFFEGPCTITMHSSSLDAFLQITDIDGTLLASDDDSGGGTDARVLLQSCSAATQSAERRAVFIFASSYFAGATGAYSLRVTYGSGMSLERLLPLAAGAPVVSDPQQRGRSSVPRDAPPTPEAVQRPPKKSPR
jgi:pimeloyl-ACP methyl ester carboxylesterase